MINQNNLFLKFLLENFTRWRKKSPLFFRIWQALLSIVVALTGLPEFLSQIGFHVWDAWMALHSTFISGLSTGALYMTFLSSASDPVSVTTDGEVNKQTDAKLLPFTAAADQRAAMKLDLPVVPMTTES